MEIYDQAERNTALEAILAAAALQREELNQLEEQMETDWTNMQRPPRSRIGLENVSGNVSRTVLENVRRPRSAIDGLALAAPLSLALWMAIGALIWAVTR